jgi:hypothetical protein
MNEPITVKFLLVTYENHGITSLIRASNGMMLASVQANRCAVLTDADPNLQPQTRLFLDNEHAVRYLKEHVAPSIAGNGVSVEFETREGDSRILTPGQMGGLGRPH